MWPLIPTTRFSASGLAEIELKTEIGSVIFLTAIRHQQPESLTYTAKRDDEYYRPFHHIVYSPGMMCAGV